MAQALDTAVPIEEQPTSILAFPWVRQLIGLAGLALAIAAGIVVALWSQEPNYAVLFEGLSDSDARAVSESLSAQEMDFRIDERSGALLVPQQDRQRIRLLLAGEGLPNSANPGMEILRQEQGIGTISRRFINLVGIKDEILAQDGHVHRRPDHGQIVQTAAEVVDLSQHRYRGRPGLSIGRRQGYRVEVRANDTP